MSGLYTFVSRLYSAWHSKNVRLPQCYFESSYCYHFSRQKVTKINNTSVLPIHFWIWKHSSSIMNVAKIIRQMKCSYACYFGNKLWIWIANSYRNALHFAMHALLWEVSFFFFIPRAGLFKPVHLSKQSFEHLIQINGWHICMHRVSFLIVGSVNVGSAEYGVPTLQK